MADHRLLGALAATVAVLTLPIGVLATVFAGWQLGVVVFVVGWFLLVPLVPVLGGELLPALRERFSDDRGSRSDATDPLTELKERYARGEVDDAEFERRVERLLEVEDGARERDRDPGARQRDVEREP